MRIKNALRNSIYSVGSYILIILVGFVSRKLFLQNLGLEFLGYEGLFANVFSLLSLAEMGTSSVIIYGLYDAVAKGKTKEIAKLMQIFKKVYALIGVFILFMGVVLSFFIPLMLKGNDYDRPFVTVIYFLQLAAVLCTYFLAYKRMLYTAEQKVFECIKIDTAIEIATKIIKLFVIMWFKNYIIYQLVQIVSAVVANLIIGQKYNKDYAHIKNQKIKVSWKDFKSINFFKDIKNAFATQLAGTVHGATDNIIISAIVGIKYIGLISNYLFVLINVNSLIKKLFEPLGSSIANQIKSGDNEQSKKMFFMFTWISFLIASFTATSYIVLFQPFIEIAFGAQYLLPFSYVIIISLDVYVGFCGYFASIYRGAFGRFEIDRNYVILAAATNLTLSLILAPFMGISGVAFGTLISQFFFWGGRLSVIYTELIHEKKTRYILKEIKWFVLFLVELFVSFKLASLNTNFVYKLCVCVVVPNIINLVVFCRSEEFKLAIEYAKRTINVIKQRKVSHD